MFSLSCTIATITGQVEWSTWGSKLESIFQPVFDTLPTLAVSSGCV